MTDIQTRNIETSAADAATLDELVGERGGIRLSLFMPIEVAPAETDKNLIRLKNLLDQADERLAAQGLDESTINAFLEPLAATLAEPSFWLRPGEAAAVFADEARIRLVDVPYRIDEQVEVSTRFVLKPLLPLMTQNPEFQVLALSQHDVYMLRGNRLALDRVEVADLPESSEEIAKFDDPEKSLQHHTSSTQSAAGRPGSRPDETIHGQGLPDDYEENLATRLFNRTAKAVDAYLKQQDGPLVLLGVGRNVGKLREHLKTGGDRIVEAHVDPSSLNDSGLRDAAWTALRPVLEAQRDDILGRLQAAFGRGEALESVEEIALAAGNGRVELVALAEGAKVPGICEPDTMEVQLVDGTDAPEATDLIDFIAAKTLAHGGTAHLLPVDRIPGGKDAVAITRYRNPV